jgi:6-phosphogluconolactonase
MGAAPDVVVEPDATTLAATVARRLVDTLRTAVEDDEIAHLVLTGGGILEQVIGALPNAGDLDWRRVHVWWGDERWVPADSDERNDKAAFEAGLARLDLDPGHVHRMPAADGGFADAEQAAAAYAAELADEADAEDVPEFDVVVLGVGPDGHCASLFPNHPGTLVTDRSVIAVHDSPKPPPDRLSLTFPSLDAAREVWFVVSGDAKADAVGRAVHGSDPHAVPSSGPKGRQRTLWLLDAAAATNLSRA